MKQKPILLMILPAILLCITSAISGGLPGHFDVDATPDPQGRMLSNSIIDIISHDETIWLGSGRGLVQHYLDGSGWAGIRSDELIGQGGVSALAVNDTIIWAATAYSEKINDGYLPAGGGVGFSRDGGESWNWMPQPVDNKEETDFHPTTTNIQNVTYDVALSETAVWITSWGGGLRKLTYDNVNQEIYRWEVVTVDGESFYALQNLRHRAFATVYADGILWVGTAAGISGTPDEGETWQHHTFVIGEPTISGNFVTALAAQELQDQTNIWAATWKANGAFESYGLCVTEDKGSTWRVALSDSTMLSGRYLVDEYGPLHVHNVGFDGTTVYAAADDGLWVSQDNGYTWGDGPLQKIYDPTIGETLEDIDFFSVVTVGDSLWLGTNAGLVVGWLPDGASSFTWRIHRAHQPAALNDQPDTYAYPSPFSPNRGHITRFQVNVTEPTDVKLKILSFAMEPVYSSGYVTLPGGGAGDMTGYGALQWDGRDDDGAVVANGVYFYQVKARGNTWWGKVMVLD